MRRKGGAIRTAVYTAGSPQGKGTRYIYSNLKLVEARCRCGRVDDVPSLLFSYTMPGTLCYNHEKFPLLLSLLLDVRSRLLTILEKAPCLILRGKAFLFTFFPARAVSGERG
jgi:hypothetical protein